MNFYESDVLVVGSGGAGLRAAIEAAQRGCTVTVVSKAATGMKTASIVTNGGFRAAVGGVTPEEHYQATMKGGKQLNDERLVEAMVHDGPTRIRELEEYGVKLDFSAGFVRCGDNPEARGLGFIQPMVERLKEMDVRLVDRCVVSKLLKEGGRVVGAVGFRDEPVAFTAKATVLATGGCAGAYPRTDCPVSIQGDGYSLAYEAGAVLRDMEFIQFVPVGLAVEGQPVISIYGDMVDDGTILNSMGEDVVEKHGVTERPLTTMSRDLLSRAMMKEIQEGRGIDGALHLDAREPVRTKGMEQLIPRESHRRVLEAIGAHEKPFKVAPVCHFTMAGIQITPDGETNIPGLYAAGEVTGGVHGANRIGGNAMTDIVVFGARAGAAASSHALKAGGSDARGLAEKESARLNGLQRGDSYIPVLPSLRELMWSKVGVIRDRRGLELATGRIPRLMMTHEQSRAEEVQGVKTIIEEGHALRACYLVALAALERRESRGTHYRLDYPSQSEDWRRPILVRGLGSEPFLMMG